MNTYAYVGGNPISRFDPFGLTECDINTAVDFAKAVTARDGLGDIDVPSALRVGELHDKGPTVNGSTSMGYILRPVTLDNRYLAELTDAGAVMLLGTVFHESMHRSQDWNWSWKSDVVKDAEHSAIHQRTSDLKAKYGDEFLKARSEQCKCK